MREDKKQARQRGEDAALSTPSEANREKHINYLDDNRRREETDNKALQERQKQWQEGIEDGETESSDSIY